MSTHIPFTNKLESADDPHGSSQQQQMDYCELPRDNPAGVVNRRRSSALSLPAPQVEMLNIDSPLIGGRHNTFGAYKFTSPTEQHNDFSPFGQYEPMQFPSNDQDKAETAEQKAIHECDACGKKLCSMRSLKRHRNTCKKVTKVDQEHCVSDDQSTVVSAAISGQFTRTESTESDKSELKSPTKMEFFTLINSQHNSSSQMNDVQSSQTTSNTAQLCHLQLSQTPSMQRSNSQSQLQLLGNQTVIMEEPSKVSDIVDSVVAKIRLQSGNNKLAVNPAITQQLITTSSGTNQTPLPSQQHRQQPQQRIFQHFNAPVEMMTTVGQQQQPPPQPQSYAQTSFIQQRQQQFQQLPPPHIAEQRQRLQQQRSIADNRVDVQPLEQNAAIYVQEFSKFQPEPPKSAPAVTTTAPPTHQQQFWPVMGARVMQSSISKQQQAGDAGSTLPLKFSIQNDKSTICSPPPYPSGIRENILPQNKQIHLSHQQQQLKPVLGNPTMALPSTVTESTKSTAESQSVKNVYRYLCPECDKPYSCRKNVKRHRISQHKVPSQEAQDGYIKRICLTESELKQMEQQKVVGGKIDSSKCKESDSKEKLALVDQPLKRDFGEQFDRKNNKPPPTSSEQSMATVGRQQSTNMMCHMQQQQHEFRGPPHSAPLPNQPQQQHFFAPYPAQYCQPTDQYGGYAPAPPMDQFYAPPDAQHQQQHFYHQQQPHQYQQPYPPHTHSSQTCMQIPPYQYHGLHHQPQRADIQQQPPPLGGNQQQQQPYLAMQGQSANAAVFSGSTQQFQQIPMEAAPSNLQPPSNNIYYQTNVQQAQPQFNVPYRPTMPGNIKYAPHQQQQYPNETYPHGQQQLQQHAAATEPALNPTQIPGANYTDTLDYWDQIKSGVDSVPTASESDAQEMAKILEDLKRTEEVTEGRHQSRNNQPTDGLFHFVEGMSSDASADGVQQPIGGGQRKAVELAEADTTFSPPSQTDDSGSRHSGASCQQQQKHFSQFIPLNQIIPESSPTYTLMGSQPVFHYDTGPPLSEMNTLKKGDQRKDAKGMGGTELTNQQQKFTKTNWNMQGGPTFMPIHQTQSHIAGADVKSGGGESTIIGGKSTVSHKKQTTTAKTTAPGMAAMQGTFVCPACNKGYSTDYSLKRHRQVCPVLNGKDGANGGNTRKRKNNAAAIGGVDGGGKGKRVEESHNADPPDSTMNESPVDEAGHSSRFFGSVASSSLDTTADNGRNVEMINSVPPQQ